MEFIRRYIFSILLFFLAGCSGSTWFNEEHGNTMEFDRNNIDVHYKIINDNGIEEMREAHFSIVERISNVSGRDMNCSLIILEDENNHKFSALGEYIIDENNRKYSLYDALVQTDTKAELDGHLNEKLAIFRMGVDSAEMKYALMGSAKATGQEFKKQ